MKIWLTSEPGESTGNISNTSVLDVDNDVRLDRRIFYISSVKMCILDHRLFNESLKVSRVSHLQTGQSGPVLAWGRMVTGSDFGTQGRGGGGGADDHDEELLTRGWGPL